MPSRIDIDVWRGNSRPAITWPLPADYTLGSTEFALTIYAGDELLLSAGIGSGLYFDLAARSVIWDRSVADSRLIPLGRIARYELEDMGFGEQTVFHGSVVGLGGDNIDGPPAMPDGSLNFLSPYNSGLQLLGWI